MVKLSKKIKLRNILNLVERLPERERLQLLRQLERKIWARKLETVIQPIRARLKSKKMTDADINQIVGEVRQERYEARSRRM